MYIVYIHTQGIGIAFTCLDMLCKIELNLHLEISKVLLSSRCPVYSTLHIHRIRMYKESYITDKDIHLDEH